MRPRVRRLTALTAVAALAAARAAAAQPAQPAPATADVVPEPQSVAPQPGRAQFADGVPILARAGDHEALATAQYLSDLLRRTRGLALPAQTGAERAGQTSIRLEITPGFPGEGYRLEITPTGARVAASDQAGLFYGAVTLWQLMTPDAGRGPVQVAAQRIDDAPRFAWRGLMVDSARHFQPPAEIERIIDAMALHKLNVLHWHLTDDQGWRLEIRKYPRLTEVGAWRTPEPGSPDGAQRYGGFYTQEDVRRIVAYAAARHVTIVPEIEMPGHATSALLAYPQFGAGPAPLPTDQVKWGILPYVYDVGDKNFGFVEDVLTEVMALFPGRYIHVGGDEAERERWNASPTAQAKLAALGSQDPAALQAYFTRRIADFLQAHGRRLVGWDEILDGGELPGDAVVTSWHGVAGGMAAAGKGHDAVLAPAPTLYFDNRQGLGPQEPPGRGALIALKDVYDFEALPVGAAPEAARHILGLQGNVWTEHVRTPDDLEAMAFPRAAAAAEDAWTQPGRKSWPGFVARLPALFARYRALDLKADPAAVAIRIAEDRTPTGDIVTLTAQPGVGEIRYTLDGGEPGPGSQAYASPLTVTAPTRVRAALFLAGARLGPIAEILIDPAATPSRASQELKLCSDGLALNLEGPPGPVRRTYLYSETCWIWPKADLDGVRSIEVALARLPFNLSLGSKWGKLTVRTPRQPPGEVEVRQDSCDADPIAVAYLPPGKVGDRAAVRLPLPERSGLHDLCVTFTATSYDPVRALERVTLLPAPEAGAPQASSRKASAPKASAP